MKKKWMTLLATVSLMLGLMFVPIHAVFAVTLDEAIDGATVKMLSDGKISSDWEAFAIARSNTPASEALRQAYYDQIVTYLNTETHLSATDYERTIIGLLSVGGDPTNIPEATTHQNLIDDLYHFNVINGGTNAVIYGILALQTKEYDVPEDATFSIQDLIDKLLSVQKADGGWALFGSASDIDVTGMAMTALAKYKDLPGVADALNRSVTYLSTVQLASGGFKGWSNENSNSLSQAIMGITMTGNNPTGSEFTKNFNAMDALMTYRTDDGGFKWLLTDAGSNSMALDQAAYALAQYKVYLNNGASIYDFVNYPVPQLGEMSVSPDPMPVPDPAPTPESSLEPIPADPAPTQPEQTEISGSSVSEAATQTTQNMKLNTSNTLPKTRGNSEMNVFTIFMGVSFLWIGFSIWCENKKRQAKRA